MQNAAGRPTFMFMPVHAAVICVAVVEMLLSAAFIAMGTVVANKLNAHLTDLHRMTIYFHCFVYVFVAFFCAFGIYGSAYGRRKFVSMFVSMMFAVIVFSLGSGILDIVFLFQPGSEQISLCSDPTLDQFSKEFCKPGPILESVTIPVFLAMWAIMILGIIVGNAHSQQLFDVEKEKEMRKFYV